MQRTELFSPRFSSSQSHAARRSHRYVATAGLGHGYDTTKASRRRPEGRNTATKPSRNAILKQMLNWTLFKSSRVNLQDNRTRHQVLAKQYTRRCKVGHSARTNSNLYCSTAVNNKRICWPRTTEKAPKMTRTAGQKQKLPLLNPAELICKTIQHVVRTARNNRPGVRSRGTQPERTHIYIV